MSDPGGIRETEVAAKVIDALLRRYDCTLSPKWAATREYKKLRLAREAAKEKANASK